VVSDVEAATQPERIPAAVVMQIAIITTRIGFAKRFTSSRFPKYWQLARALGSRRSPAP
jgi:hypothetical protein